MSVPNGIFFLPTTLAWCTTVTSGWTSRQSFATVGNIWHKSRNHFQCWHLKQRVCHLPSIVAYWKCIVSGIWDIFSQQIKSLLSAGSFQNNFGLFSRYPTIEVANGARPCGILCHVYCSLQMITTDAVSQPAMLITQKWSSHLQLKLQNHQSLLVTLCPESFKKTKKTTS